MGQRFQVLISTPPSHLKPGNPNNRDREYHCFHCQWLFGASAVIYCDKLAEKIEELIEYEKETWHNRGYRLDLSPHNYSNKGVEGAIHAATYFFWPDVPHFSVDGDGIDQYPYLRSFYNDTIIREGLVEALRKRDNNNGQFIVFITDDYNIKYFFWNPKGAERNKTIEKELTAKEYLLEYYSQEEIDQMESPKGIEVWDRIHEALNNFEERETTTINEVWSRNIAEALNS